MNGDQLWYLELVKPWWAPPAWLFGPVWSVLYLTILITFAWVFWQIWRGRFPRTLFWPFCLNIFFNLAFTPIQFGLKNNWLASIDILLVLITLVWALRIVWPYARFVTYANLPYLVWVGFASILQLSITWLNW